MYSAQLCCGSTCFLFYFIFFFFFTRPTTNDICGAPERKSIFQYRLPVLRYFSGSNENGLRASNHESVADSYRRLLAVRYKLSNCTVWFGSAAEKRKTEEEKRWKRGSRKGSASCVFILFLQ